MAGLPFEVDVARSINNDITLGLLAFRYCYYTWLCLRVRSCCWCRDRLARAARLLREEVLHERLHARGEKIALDGGHALGRLCRQDVDADDTAAGLGALDGDL